MHFIGYILFLSNIYRHNKFNHTQPHAVFLVLMNLVLQFCLRKRRDREFSRFLNLHLHVFDTNFHLVQVISRLQRKNDFMILTFRHNRFTQPPADLLEWFEDYLDDEEVSCC